MPTPDTNTTQPLPHPGGVEISALLDSILAEYNWPSNPKNAARAGWTAAMRYLAAQPAAPEVAEPMGMALCEIHRVVIRPGQLYTFSRVGDCEKCASMEREAVEAYEPVGIVPIDRPAARHALDVNESGFREPQTVLSSTREPKAPATSAQAERKPQDSQIDSFERRVIDLQEKAFMPYAQALELAASEIGNVLCWVHEFGAIGLPMGHASRKTCFTAYETLDEAVANAKACEFNDRILPVFHPTECCLEYPANRGGLNCPPFQLDEAAGGIGAQPAAREE